MTRDRADEIWDTLTGFRSPEVELREADRVAIHWRKWARDMAEACLSSAARAGCGDSTPIGQDEAREALTMVMKREIDRQAARIKRELDNA